jgi:hypothetical protein
MKRDEITVNDRQVKHSCVSWAVWIMKQINSSSTIYGYSFCVINEKE